jgi:hypothetical protein
MELKQYSHQEVPNLETLLTFSNEKTVLHDLCGVFPGLDAMAFPNLALQYTCAKRHNLHLKTFADLNTHLSNNDLEICFVVPDGVFDDWKVEQSYEFHTVHIKLKQDEIIVWEGKFQCDKLLNADVIKLKYPNVKVELTKDGNAEIEIANHNYEVKIWKKNGSNLAVTDSYTLSYCKQTNTSSYEKLPEELKILLKGVTQKVICLPGVENLNDHTSNDYLAIDSGCLESTLVQEFGIVEENKKKQKAETSSAEINCSGDWPIAKKKKA